MLNKTLGLFVAELQRLKKYNILQISFVLDIIYAILLVLSTPEEATLIVTMLVAMDVSMMSIVLLGASMFFERQEGSLKSVMVAPVSVFSIVTAKACSTLFLSLFNATILGLIAIFVQGASINLALLLLFTLLGGLAHIMIGFFLILVSKDFNALFINYIIFVFVFTLPAILYSVGIFAKWFKYVLFLSPSYLSIMLINTSAGFFPTVAELVFGIIILIAVVVCLYIFVVQKKFKQYVIKG